MGTRKEHALLDSVSDLRLVTAADRDRGGTLAMDLAKLAGTGLTIRQIRLVTTIAIAAFEAGRAMR